MQNSLIAKPQSYRRHGDVEKERKSGAAAPLSLYLSVTVAAVALWQTSVKLIEHQVDDHAGHRDVEPDRQSPARDLSVKVESLLQRAGERHEDHRHDRDGQSRVRDQNEKVDGTNDSFSLEPRGAQLLAEVVNQIRSQKQRRGNERANHRSLVGFDLLLTNEEVTRDEQDRADAVEDRVQSRKL